MYWLEKSEHDSVAAKIVLFLGFEKKTVKYRAKIPGLRPRTRERESLILIVLGPKLSLRLKLFY